MIRWTPDVAPRPPSSPSSPSSGAGGRPAGAPAGSDARRRREEHRDRPGDRGRPAVRALAGRQILARPPGRRHPRRGGRGAARRAAACAGCRPDRRHGELRPRPAVLRGVGRGREWTGRWSPARCAIRPRARRTARGAAAGRTSAARRLSGPGATELAAAGDRHRVRLRRRRSGPGRREVLARLLPRIGRHPPVRRGVSWTSATWPPAGWTALRGRRSICGTAPRGARGDRGRLRTSGLHGRPPGALTVAASPAVAAELTTLLEELGADDLGDLLVSR